MDVITNCLNILKDIRISSYGKKNLSLNLFCYDGDSEFDIRMAEKIFPLGNLANIEQFVKQNILYWKKLSKQCAHEQTLEKGSKDRAVL